MPTQFGALINPASVDDVNKLADILGVNLLRTSIEAKDFTGSHKPLEKILSWGKDVSININWDKVGRDPQTGNKVPVPFPTDQRAYKSKVTAIFTKYGKNPLIKAWVCENEPTTANFHSGPMSDYLQELTWFTEVGRAMGIPYLTAGAVHTELVNAVKNNTDLQTDEGKAGQVKELLTGYKNIPVHYLTFHTSTKTGTYPKDVIVETAAWALNFTGKTELIYDEWHIDDYPSIDQGATALRYIVQQQKKAGVIFSIYISGTGDDDKPILNDRGTYNLTALGTAYKDEIPKVFIDPDKARLKEIWPVTKEGIALTAKIDPAVQAEATKVIYSGETIANS